MRVHFSTDDVPPCDRESYWREIVAKHVLKVAPSDRPDPATYWGQLDAELTERFTLFNFQDCHRSRVRTAADVRRDTSERFQLDRFDRERIYSAAPARSTAVEIRQVPGDFYITSSEWPFRATMRDWLSVGGLTIPQSVLSPLLAGGRLTRPVTVPAGSPLGSLVGAAFDAAVKQVPLLSRELGDAVLENLCGLVALACGASDEGRWSAQESLRGARLESAKRHIDQHLTEHGLTPASTAAALGISLRQLHLLFEPTGTSFAQYVARLRLLRCRAALAGPTGAIRSVADIAFGWGFNSLATFYRAFEREFGLPPAALRAAGRRPGRRQPPGCAT
jgi:AraC-like DNA-binding protein